MLIEIWDRAIKILQGAEKTAMQLGRKKKSENWNKVNRCLARYSPRATTTNQISLHGLAQIDQKCQIWSFLGKKSFSLLEKSKALLPT